MKLRQICAVTVVAATTTLAGHAFAQSEQGQQSRYFGQGQPSQVSDLPPGQLKRKINQLPAQAKGRAMKWLQEISFAEEDLGTLDVDANGNIFYADSIVIAATENATSADAPATEAAPQVVLDNAFTLHSKPFASNTVFLDFDGHTFTNTAWGSGTFVGKPYDLDGAGSTFNNEERSRIVDIWHRVSEDLAQFDINVTTEDPGSFNSQTGHVLITHTIDATGKNMPSNGGGGVAYVNVFGLSNYHTYYSPALVYFNQLGGGGATYVAEASSHEFGHNLGLSHDGTSGVTYYGGLGENSQLTSWAPIMGNSYNKNITQWSKGEYPGANQTQDDLAIIAGKLGFAGDDHGDNNGAATDLFVDGAGNVLASNPEFDPDNELPENKGRIDDANDVDVFSFIAGAGNVNLTVTPAWDAFPRSTRRGANLDIRAELVDAGGSLVAASDPLSDTEATISANVGAGAYYLRLEGVGNANTPYTDYASQGQYYINGSVPVGVADTNAPSPNPMGFSSAPAAISSSEIAMTALQATDDISSVQYRFRCTVGGSNCGASDSGWQSSRSYTAGGLADDTQYTFVVSARDQSGNETAASNPASASTDELPPPPAFQDFVAQSETPVAGSLSTSFGATQADGGAVQVITERESGGRKNSRYTYLEHRWNFNISAGASVTAFINAWRSGSNSSESFDIEYSTNGGSSYSKLMNVSSSSTGNVQSAQLNGTPSGAIILRVVDTVRQSGVRSVSSFNVDHLYLQVSNPPAVTEPPDGVPSGINASATSSSTAQISWNDNSSNEAGFTLQRKLSSSSSWSTIATLAPNGDSYADSALTGNTAYDYRVRAFNDLGVTAWISASVTTQVAPAVSLSTGGSKDKGKHVITLSWQASGNVDVFRDGSMIASNVGGSSYVDATGRKGGATYSHQVCLTGTSTCSNSSTTQF